MITFGWRGGRVRDDEKTPFWRAFGGLGLLWVGWDLATCQKRGFSLLVVDVRRVIGSAWFRHDVAVTGDNRRIHDADVKVGLHLFNAERVGWPDDELGIEKDASLSARRIDGVGLLDGEARHDVRHGAERS